MATKSPLAKALKGNQGKLPQQLQDAIKAAPESPAKQTRSGAPSRTKKVGGEDYYLGRQDLGTGQAHYYNEGYSPKHEKKGAIQSAGDGSVYHISRKTEKPVKLNKKKANIK